ncbi:hypothetical protein LTR56_003305 [Elasticomyces elasticus]|nr:hypothetical protein LTR56_003305 [Elasticomyces elasticus]KAK3664277.1 hypothetical protein LTR22_004975 [Elasticomyces elasticus]KAK4931493.1 hypothetical protein LTR49_002194 [Elasticomyces elasticus]KAK5765988.1 hypothetical protein LTS12_003734 [Elasticomyces elasticus]
MALPTAQHHQPPQGLPSISSLTTGLPSSASRLPSDQHSLSESTRDSGTWPQPQSKRKSFDHAALTERSATHASVPCTIGADFSDFTDSSANCQGLQVHTLLNPDDSPPQNSIPNTPLSARNPYAARSNGSQLPSINQGFHHDHNRDSRDYPPTLDSRRSSVDSRMHQTFNNLYINHPTSPYESANTSQVSLAASLRKPNGGGPMSPLSARSSIRSFPAPRIAPPIMPIGRVSGAPDPTAARPTQGYAWAFPDQPIPEERGDSDSDTSSISRNYSRTNSIAGNSIRSSIFSNDSHLPPGQRRLGEEHATTHHHSLQHRTIQEIQNDKLQQQMGNYSRTPELRVSHKLAERKRRSEMKDLFEDLNKAVPANGGTKASKWEILTKAIDYIRSVQQNERNLTAELQRLSRDAEYARETQKENDMLKTEIQVMHQHLRRHDPNAPHVYGHFTSQLNQSTGPQTNGTSSIALPPLNSGPGASAAYNGVAPPVAAMQGVEYSGYGGR